MFAIFDENNNYIKNNDIPDNNLKSLEIGKDIEWEIVIRRNGEIIDIEKKDLQQDDIILKKYWKIKSLEITRNKKRMTIEEKNLQKNDIIEQKNYIKQSENDIIGYRICRGGNDLQIKTKNMLDTDVIKKQFDKQWIKTNDNNEFIIKTENEKLEEIKIKIMDAYKNNISNKEIINKTYTQKIIDLQTEIDKLSIIEDANLLYNKVLSKAI